VKDPYAAKTLSVLTPLVIMVLSVELSVDIPKIVSGLFAGIVLAFPTSRSLAVRAVNVPMQRPLKTGGGEVRSAAMVLVDLLTEEEVSGCSYLFCPTPLVLEPVAKLLSNLAPLIEGNRLAPLEIERKLHNTFRLLEQVR
jgi:Mandelate racemase / muconate lactonizing enzyme, N-terminal domain